MLGFSFGSLFGSKCWLLDRAASLCVSESVLRIGNCNLEAELKKPRPNGGTGRMRTDEGRGTVESYSTGARGDSRLHLQIEDAKKAPKTCQKRQQNSTRAAIWSLVLRANVPHAQGATLQGIRSQHISSSSGTAAQRSRWVERFGLGIVE